MPRKNYSRSSGGERVQLIQHQLVDILKTLGSLLLSKITEGYLEFPAVFFIPRSLKMHSKRLSLSKLRGRRLLCIFKKNEAIIEGLLS